MIATKSITPQTLPKDTGAWEIKEKIKESNHSHIYLVKDKKGMTFVGKHIFSSSNSPKEWLIWKDLNHKNIVRLIDAYQNWFIMDFSVNGSLDKFLQATSTSVEQKMNFCLQIAKGMEYLASLNIIHADLAARNVLVFDDQCKICDFGMSFILTEEPTKMNRYVPICWSAPELLKDKMY